MPVHPSPNVDDHRLAHVDAAFEGGGGHVGEEHHFPGLGELDQARVDGRLMLETLQRAFSLCSIVEPVALEQHCGTCGRVGALVRVAVIVGAGR